MAGYVTTGEGANSLHCGVRNAASRRPDRLESSHVNIDFDVAHSEKNILDWMEYLPQDCIETMIRMGWDCTT